MTPVTSRAPFGSPNLLLSVVLPRVAYSSRSDNSPPALLCWFPGSCHFTISSTTRGGELASTKKSLSGLTTVLSEFSK